jgi:hypothetical protein
VKGEKEQIDSFSAEGRNVNNRMLTIEGGRREGDPANGEDSRVSFPQADRYRVQLYRMFRALSILDYIVHFSKYFHEHSLGFDLNNLVKRKKIWLEHIRVERGEIEQSGE